MKREASGKSAGKGLAHRLSVVLPLFAGAMLLALLVQASIPALKDELRKKAEDAHDAHPA